MMQALELHSHEEGHDHGHHHEDAIEVEPYIWKMLCTTGTAWIFFNLQIILQWIGSTISRRRSKASITHLTIRILKVI